MYKSRVPNAFEKIILVVGIVVIVLGYVFIHKQIIISGEFGWQAIQTILMWFILIVVIILLAVNENMKEELVLIAERQLDEIKIMTRAEKTDINLDEAEIKLLKRIMKKKKL